jgi:hypothetical protein
MKPETAAELFHCYHANPKLIPVPLARALLESESRDLRQVGSILLLELDPGLLMRQRASDEVVECLLRETSNHEGVLFFEDRLYSPLLPGWVEYSKE